MSRGNIIQGQASGKLGSTVLMVRNGQQLARVYTTAGARSGDQASESARIQRVKFGSASNQWGLYKYVSTRMYRKGRTSNQSDYNYFVKRNAFLLPYFTKQENADGVHVLMPGTFSEGNLGRIELVHSYFATISTSTSNLTLRDTQAHTLTSTNWTDTMQTIKARLAVAYPAARKVTFLLSVASEVNIISESESYISQVVNHNTVVIDLYNEVTPGENEQTAAQYFGARISSPAVKAIVEAQTKTIFYDHHVLRLWATSEQEAQTIGTIGALVFATDDNASDCYTTVLPENAVTPTAGVFALWSSYRTEQSLRVAADSYGYQSGVMRDYVASVGNELEQQVVSYVAKLRQVDAAAAEDYVKELEAAGGAKARTVRQAAPTEEK